MMLSILSLNVCGVQRLDFENSLHYLIVMYNLDLMFLIGTKLSHVKLMHISTKFGFDGSHSIDSEGFYGALWILWRKSLFHAVLVHVPGR